MWRVSRRWYTGAQLADVLWSAATLWRTPGAHAYDLLAASQPVVDHVVERLVDDTGSFR